ncbi:hypothetical protein MAR_038254 [Mya arenaria]|uniref:Dynamin N-terminal domain-containing protein n=1 Tax=Mya arenaria TaxID=6604 RepID=A0ABY7FRC6_MYAAR|nr:hypothetical protein MAR_038254 [Mya arenaria]
MADGGSLQREIYSRVESHKDNTTDGTSVIGNSTDTMNGDADDAPALDPGSDIRLEDVESMDLGDVFDFLEAREVPCPDVVDLKEMHDLVRRTLRQEADNAPSCPAAGADDGRDGHLAEALTKDTVMKQELAEIYDRVIPFIRTGLNTDLRDPLIKLYGTNFEARLEQNRSELLDGECPIVVAGETSAGKSSLLNLLLGTDILPHSLLSSTSTICRLHNIRSTDKRRFVVYPEGGGASVCHNIEEGREKEALEKLKVAVSENRSNPGEYCSQVEIYWPIPLLGENTQVTIVDTPGVGESGEMTSRLFRYLPHAIAFIYVLNSANAGGIQEDRENSNIRLVSYEIPLFYSTTIFIHVINSANAVVLEGYNTCHTQPSGRITAVSIHVINSTTAGGLLKVSVIRKPLLTPPPSPSTSSTMRTQVADKRLLSRYTCL